MVLGLGNTLSSSLDLVSIESISQVGESLAPVASSRRADRNKKTPEVVGAKDWNPTEDRSIDESTPSASGTYCPESKGCVPDGTQILLLAISFLIYRVSSRV